MEKIAGTPLGPIRLSSGTCVTDAGAELEGGVGAKSGDLGDGSPPLGSKGEAPAEGLGDVPQQLEHF